MTSTTILHSARYSDPTNTLIDFNLTHNGETFDFTYHPDDPAPLSVVVRAMIADLQIPIEPYVDRRASVQVPASGSGANVVA